ncbi:MAG: acyl-CoA thioesterase, partial [Flavobacteriaceae bacterium]
FDEPLRIRLAIYDIPRATIKIDYIIMNALDKEIANGSTTLAFLNTEINRPVRCPQALLEIIGSL